MKILPEVIYYCVPGEPEKLKLYRYTSQTFIDSFFTNGHLRLTSLKVYRADASASPACINPKIADNNEGKAILTQSKNDNAKVYTDFSQGVLNLSTSLTLSSNILESFQQGEGDNGHYGVFEILEPVTFASIIAKKIYTLYPLTQVMIGKCDCVKERRKNSVDAWRIFNNTVVSNTSEQRKQNIPSAT